MPTSADLDRGPRERGRGKGRITAERSRLLNLFSCEAAHGGRLPGEREIAVFQYDPPRKPGGITITGDRHHSTLTLRNVN